MFENGGADWQAYTLVLPWEDQWGWQGVQTNTGFWTANHFSSFSQSECQK